ncbi:hypothetical protein HAX54_005599 [Datura stramonium]|uniref:Uncharacterized protein n=1 Tax=Datura stramonium TaxID=4076 RepID=A0ABS8TA90_DATST|nr:hypothetical protein [Datura stramonium]
MEEIDSLWGYQETMDETRQKLLYTSLELERMTMESSEEKRKNNQLIQLIKIAYQERDEARDNLHKLLNKINQYQIHIDSPLAVAKAPKANSIESNSLSETYNYNSHNSSSSLVEESFLDVVSSPDLSNNIIPVSCGVVPQQQVPEVVDRASLVINSLVKGKTLPQQVPEVVDHASLVIDSLVKGKTLPQQGKLLQSVLEAGPLLQTLLVAGPLPRWRNPPQFKPLHIPPVSIKGCCEGGMITRQNSNVNSSHFGSSMMMNSQPYFEMSCGSSQMLSPYLGYQSLVSAGTNCNNFVHLDKRQRLQ